MAAPRPPYDGRVFVNVVRATGLVPADRGGTSDPYVKIELLQGKPGHQTRATAKTSVVNKTLDPEWYEEHVFDVDADKAANCLLLRVAVWDHDLVGSDDYLGEVDVDLQRTFGTLPGHWMKPDASSYEIVDPKEKVKKKHRLAGRSRGNNTLGQLQLQVHYGRTLEQLEADARAEANRREQVKRRRSASVTIQKAQRRLACTKQFQRQIQKATLIQAVARGRIGRRQHALAVAAITKLQAALRGMRERGSVAAITERLIREKKEAQEALLAAQQKTVYSRGGGVRVLAEGPRQALRRVQQRFAQPPGCVPLFLGGVPPDGGGRLRRRLRPVSHGGMGFGMLPFAPGDHFRLLYRTGQDQVHYLVDACISLCHLRSAC
jgi:hypothetical protein